jgi:glucokinase
VGPVLLGIEIGGTKLQLALGDADGSLRLVERLTVRPEGGAEAIRRQIIGTFARLLDRAGAVREDVRAAGIGFGGPVDAPRGACVGSNQVAGWEAFPLAEWAQEALGVPRVVVANDSDAAALAEAQLGAGRGISPLLYVNSGSGVGGGLVVDGRLYPGNGLGAIEIGHLILDGFPPRANGAPRTLESLASGWAIALAAAERLLGMETPTGPLTELVGRNDPGRVTAERVARAAAAGDPVARAVLRRATTAMGHALAHAVTLLGPRRVVLGGGVSLMPAPLWLDPIRAELDNRVFPAFRGTFDVVCANLGEMVVVQGALCLAADCIPDRETTSTRPGPDLPEEALG